MSSYLRTKPLASSPRSAQIWTRSRAGTWAPCLRRPRRYQRDRYRCARGGSPPVRKSMSKLGRLGLASNRGEDQHRQPSEEATRRWRGGRRDNSARDVAVKLWIPALLATAGVSLFLFLAILCNCGRATASSDVAAGCQDTRLHERGAREGVRRFTSRWWLELQRLDRVFALLSQAVIPLHIVLLSSCCVAATPRIQPPRLLGLRRRAHARSLARSSLVVDAARQHDSSGRR